MSGKLTGKQRLFVAEYVTDLNATRAAIAAGYSAKSASVTGSQLIRLPKVSEEIAKYSRKLTKKTAEKMGNLEITAERVLQEVARLAFVDPRKFYGEDGHLKKIADLDDDTAAALAGMDVTELSAEGAAVGLLKKIKFADKGANLERLMKYLKLFTVADEGKSAISITVQVNHVNATAHVVPIIGATVQRIGA